MKKFEIELKWKEVIKKQGFVIIEADSEDEAEESAYHKIRFHHYQSDPKINWSEENSCRDNREEITIAGITEIKK